MSAMAISKKLLPRLIVLFIIAAIATYLWLAFKRQDAVKLQLNQLLQQAIEEKSSFRPQFHQWNCS